MKRTIIVTSIVVALCICVFAGSAIATGQIDWGIYKGWPMAKIKIDDQLKEPPSPAIIIHGTTYVPLRFVSESMGIGVDWDQTNRTVLLSSDGSSSTTQQTDDYQYPPVSQTGDSVTVSINHLSVDTTAITMNVTITNNTSQDLDFPASLTTVVIGNTQYDEPTDYDSKFIDDLKPGVSKTGDLVFPGASPTSKLKVYFKTWIGSSLDGFEPIFYVQQGS